MSAQLTSPNTNDCIGGSSYAVNGVAQDGQTGPTDPSFAGTLQVRDGSTVLQTRTFSHESSGGYLTSIDTTSLPATFTLFLRVTTDTGEATATNTVTPTYDRQAPYPAPETSVLAVSSRAAWTKTTYSRDYGCAGPAVRFTVGATDASGGEVALHYRKPSIGEPSPGVLNIGSSYRLWTEAVDANGLTTRGPSVAITTPSDLKTVLAGVVTSNGAGRAGVRVGDTMTYAGGRYALPLAVGQQTIGVQYGPCLIPYPGYCQPTSTVVDQVTTPTEVGLIVARNRSLP